MSNIWQKFIHSRFITSILRRFRGFWTLIVMQLKEQLSFSFKADKKGTLTKLILLGVGFVVITAAIALIISILGSLGILGNGILPVSMFNVFFYLILIMSTLSCIHRMTNSLYFSKDNQVLLTYPVNSGTIFLSKMVVFYVLELMKNLLMLVPLLLAYGIVNSFPIFYYPWMIFVFLVVSLLPVAIGGVISIPYMYFLRFMKKSQYIQCILAILALIGISGLIFYGLSLIPADLKIATKWATVYYPQVNGFTQTIERYSGPLLYISSLFLGYRGYRYNPNPKSLPIVNKYTGIILLIVIGVITISFILSYLLARPLFFKMASKSFEYKKKIINHNYKMNMVKAELYERAFRPQLVYPISRNDKFGIVNKLSRLLRRVLKEEKLFLRRKINTKRVLKMLNKYSKNLKFEEVALDQITDFGYVIQIRNGVPFLVLIKGIRGSTADCYDPYYLRRKNFKTNSFLSTFVKDILLDLRNPSSLVSNFMLFIVTPLAIALLNAIFRAINASFQGQTFTIMFNVLIVMLITLASNVSMASIYSREGNTSYMLKASPTNYMLSLNSKLAIRGIIVTLSLIFTCIIYGYFSPVKHLRPDLLFFTFFFTYLGHLTWSAELDYMNPQDRLYSEVGINVNNPNERLSAILTFVISAVFAALTMFFVSKEVNYAFIKLLIISIIFFVARIILFYLKIMGYGTSRSERRDN